MSGARHRGMYSGPRAPGGTFLGHVYALHSHPTRTWPLFHFIFATVSNYERSPLATASVSQRRFNVIPRAGKKAAVRLNANNAGGRVRNNWQLFVLHPRILVASKRYNLVVNIRLLVKDMRYQQRPGDLISGSMAVPRDE